MSAEEPTPKAPDEMTLRAALEEDAADWDSRKKLARLLYDRGDFAAAAELVWEADEIPGIDLELAFAARVLAKAAPRKAIRLLTAVLELNRGKAVQNLGLANALLHHGMVLQAARFYGAALEADPGLGNAELEHFVLWTDDEETLWGDFRDRRPQLGELPWMKRDPREAMKLTSSISKHTTPIKVASLEKVEGEELDNEMYRQEAKRGAEPSPPPAVTIPVDRVAPKDRLVDSEKGAPEKPAAVTPEKPAPGRPGPKPAGVTPKPGTPPPAPGPGAPVKVAPPPTIQPAGAGGKAADNGSGEAAGEDQPAAPTQRKLNLGPLPTQKVPQK